MLRKWISLVDVKFSFMSVTVSGSSLSSATSKSECEERILMKSAPIATLQAAMITVRFTNKYRSIGDFFSRLTPSIAPIAKRNCQANGLKNSLWVRDATCSVVNWETSQMNPLALSGSRCSPPLAPRQQPDHTEPGRIERQRSGQRRDDRTGRHGQAATEREAVAVAEGLPAEDVDQLRRVAHAGPAFGRERGHSLRIIVKMNVVIVLLRKAACEHEARRVASRHSVVERIGEVA